MKSIADFSTLHVGDIYRVITPDRAFTGVLEARIDTDGSASWFRFHPSDRMPVMVCEVELTHVHKKAAA